MPTPPRLVAALAAPFLLLGSLTACASDPATPSAGGAPSSPAVATPSSTAGTSTSPIASTTAATPASETTTSAAPAAGIDSVQLRLDSSDEVSPGVLQGQGIIFVEIEWMGVSDGAAYDGEKCAAVITVSDPGGKIVLTDRQSTCSGDTSVTIRPGTTGTGTYTVTASLAPWEDADNATESTSEFDVIAWGT
ncbi:hypothetical protein G6009_03950 [Dietzia sp. SLG510A3-30A2]|nr:hypothetical protein [Dietzia sp. SLG510A3-30A2]